MEKITLLGTGSAMVTKCYNTCFTISKDDEYFLVDCGGGNTILTNLEKSNIPINIPQDPPIIAIDIRVFSDILHFPFFALLLSTPITINAIKLIVNKYVYITTNTSFLYILIEPNLELYYYKLYNTFNK